ncbi:MAG: TolC family protein [Williamsia sp.]|nr:TolC family protein [Williamsia sp.]
MTRLYTIVWLLLASLPSSATAQKKLNLPRCYQLLLENNLFVREAQNKVSAEQINKKIVQGNRLPAVAFDLGHYFSFGKNIDPVTNGFVQEAFSGGNMEVGLELRVFSGFYALYAARQSSYRVQAAEFARKNVELEKLAGLIRTYARILFNKEQAGLVRSNIEATTKALEIVNEKINVGKVSKSESYLLTGRLYSEQAGLTAVQNDSAAALLQLKQLLNIPYSEEVEVEEIDLLSLAAVSDKPVAAEELMEAVLEKHPAIRQARAAEQVMRMEEKIIRSSLFPSLFVGGNLVSNYSANQKGGFGQKLAFNRQLNNNLGQNIGISLHVPVFSRGETINRIRKQKLLTEGAHAALQETEQELTRQSLQFVNDYNAARQQYKATAASLELTGLSYSMYEEKSRLGQVSSLELVAAKDVLNTARSAYLQTKIELYFKYQLLQLLKTGF